MLAPSVLAPLASAPARTGTVHSAPGAPGERLEITAVDVCLSRYPRALRGCYQAVRFSFRGGVLMALWRPTGVPRLFQSLTHWGFRIGTRADIADVQILTMVLAYWSRY